LQLLQIFIDASFERNVTAVILACPVILSHFRYSVKFFWKKRSTFSSSYGGKIKSRKNARKGLKNTWIRGIIAVAIFEASETASLPFTERRK
jgi:hypothetical protein